LCVIYCIVDHLVLYRERDLKWQKFIEIGAKQIIPVATTVPVSRHLRSQYEKKKGALEMEMTDVQSVTVNCDLWPHDNTNASYIS